MEPSSSPTPAFGIGPNGLTTPASKWPGSGLTESLPASPSFRRRRYDARFVDIDQVGPTNRSREAAPSSPASNNEPITGWCRAFSPAVPEPVDPSCPETRRFMVKLLLLKRWNRPNQLANACRETNAMEATRRNSAADCENSDYQFQRSLRRAPFFSHQLPPPSPKSSERLTSLSRIRRKNNEENQGPKTQPPSSPLPSKDITKKPEVASLGKILRTIPSLRTSYLHRRAGRESPVGIQPSSRPPATEMPRYGKGKSFTGPVSAWALSPGRSTPPHTPRMIPPVSSDSASSGGERQRSRKISSVLSFFRPRMAHSGQEDAMQQLRVLQTRLIQWRFVNAKAQAAIHARTRVSENQTRMEWLLISRLRNSITEKKMEVHRLTHDIKLDRLLDSQMRCLHEWEKMEKKNMEAVARTSRLLEAIVARVPIVGGAKGNVGSILRVMYVAMDIMEKIEAAIARFCIKTCLVGSVVVELVKITSQERSSINELMDLISTVASLEAQECSLRAHLIQASEATN
ncbi:QWRF motif-containing protein 7 [Nymphaea thermarum]|nr:QWRF motif-containing protein 7 [Nymphaea thermarum]